MRPRRQPTATSVARNTRSDSALSVRARGMDVSKLDMEIVSAVHRALTGRVGHERFAVWFGRGVRMEPCGKTLRIAAADTFRLDNLRRLVRADLVEATRIAGQLLDIGLEDVEFVVDASLSAAKEGAAQADGQPTAANADVQRRCEASAEVPREGEAPVNSPAGKPSDSHHSPRTAATLSAT